MDHHLKYCNIFLDRYKLNPGNILKRCNKVPIVDYRCTNIQNHLERLNKPIQDVDMDSNNMDLWLYHNFDPYNQVDSDIPFVHYG